MNDHTELLARADRDDYGRMELLQLKHELTEALQTAITERDEALARNRFGDALRLDAQAVVAAFEAAAQRLQAWVSAPEDNK